jgi:branched-chain amino acid transport system ATP-binding protein
MLLEARGINKVFGGLKAVQNIDYVQDAQTICSIIGPNGAGKTTFFNVLTGIYKPDGGTLTFNGKSIGGLGPEQVNAAGMSRTFQNIRLFNNMTVLENIMVGMHSRLHINLVETILHLPSFSRQEGDVRRKGRKLLDFVGLSGKANDLSRNLPYGDQRRLEVARALASDPKLILLDEPTAGMNPQETSEAMALFRRVRDDLGVTVLLIEHDMRVVMGISERITVLDHGQKIAEGSPEEIRRNPQVIEAYLGRGSAGDAPTAATSTEDIDTHAIA